MEQLLFTTKPSPALSIDAWIGAFIACMTINGVGVNVSQIAAMVLHYHVELIWVFLGSLLPFLGAIWRTAVLHCIRYTVSDQRIVRRTGVFSTLYDEVDFLRVRDFLIHQPFYLRLMGLGHLTIISTDRTTPVLTILAQPEVHELRDTFRELTLSRQRALGYREVEVGN